jgi:hypothetical protein
MPHHDYISVPTSWHATHLDTDNGTKMPHLWYCTVYKLMQLLDTDNKTNKLINDLVLMWHLGYCSELTDCCRYATRLDADTNIMLDYCIKLNYNMVAFPDLLNTADFWGVLWIRFQTFLVGSGSGSKRPEPAPDLNIYFSVSIKLFSTKRVKICQF